MDKKEKPLIYKDFSGLDRKYCKVMSGDGKISYTKKPEIHDGMKNRIEANRPLKKAVRIDDAFWNPKLRTFLSVTLPDTFRKFEKDGTLENFQDVIRGKKGTHRACPWHDGLLYETIRGASDYMARGENDPALVALIDRCIDVIAEAQEAAGGGYIHTLVLLNYPAFRYGENGGNILWQHDLYNHGCLFEAAVHYYRATGKTKLLEVALKAANELSSVIGEPPGKWVVPGHPLPEYALLELYELVTDEPGIADKVGCPVNPEAYHALAKFWVHGRGHHAGRVNHPQYMGEYAQDHAPVHRQFQAVGHAVRATLYYTGVTREAMLDGDRELLNDSLRLWRNVESRKLHINGGVGATHFEEKFGEDYDLDNHAYLETCAAAGLIFWAESLSRATGDARFFQTVERGLYNLMLSSVSLQGDSYFYRNPLISDGSDHHWAWHTCPCCPPMIHKIFGMMDRLIYAQSDDSLFVNLLIGSEAQAELQSGIIRVRAETRLPWEGTYALTVTEAAHPFRLMVRVPSWAEDLRFSVNGQPADPEVENGYAVFTVNRGDTISFRDSLNPVRIEAHAHVSADRGRVAITRGPLVYCVEGVDNHGEVDFVLAEDPELTPEERSDLLGAVTVIHGKTAENEAFTAVPLYAWDNRMAGKMNVWIRQDGKNDTGCTDGWQDGLYRRYAAKR